MSTKLKNPNKVAVAIRKEKHLMFLEGCFYLYEGGFYKPVPDIEIERMIKQKLGPSSGIRTISEVSRSLMLDCYKKRSDLPAQEEYVNVLNGMLNLKTARPVPHSPNLYSIVQLPVNFRPNKSCPLFSKVVSEWLEDVKKVQLLQEFLGYCLLPCNDQEKMLFLVGEGGNGKSTLIKVITEVFGYENCSFLSMDKLSARFTVAGLRGKAINLSSETPSKAVLCDDLIKSIVSGDEIPVEEKYKPPCSFTPTAKLIIACNAMPRTEDRSQAINRRILILNFNKSYSDKDCDKKLARKLFSEKDGIFRWILKGLLQLRKRGYFEEPDESVREREEYQKENNPVMVFVEDCCRIDPLGSVSIGGLYDSYRQYCNRAGNKPLSKTKFGKEIRRLYKVKDETGTSDGTRSRMLIGISLTEDAYWGGTS